MFSHDRFREPESVEMRNAILPLFIVSAAGGAALAQAPDAVFDLNKPYDLEIVTWTADKETEGLTWEWLVTEYQRFRPNVRIKKEIQSNQTYPSWAMTQFISGTAPDIMQSFPWKAHQWGAELGYLVPLRKYLNRPNPHDPRDAKRYPTWMSCLYEELLEHNADPYYGEIWTIPISLNTQRFYYNKDIFKRYDLKVPRTFTEMGEVCRHVRERSAGTIVPIAMPSDGAWLDYLGAGVNSDTLDRFDLIRKDANVTEAEELVAALRGMWNCRTEQLYSFHKLLKKMNDGGWFQEGWTGFDLNQCDNLFANGRAAMIREGYWMKEGFDKRIAGAFEFGVMREPYIDKEFAGRDLGRMLEMMGSYGSEVAVTRSCADRGRLAAAIDFLQWVTSPEVAIKLSGRRGAMPSTRDLDASLPAETRVFKPEVGGRPGGPLFYGFNPGFQMREAVAQVAPLYVSGQMELSELQDFLSKYEKRFVDLALRDTQESTQMGIVKGARLYARFVYDQEQWRRRADRARSEGSPQTLALESRRAEVLSSCAVTMDNLSDMEEVVKAVAAAAYPGAGGAGYWHRPIIDKPTGEVLGHLAHAAVGVALVGLGLYLMRKKRIARMLGFPEKSIYAFLLPSLLFVLVFSYYPAFSGIYHAFTQWNGAGIDEFIGLGNFRELCRDQILGVSVLNLAWMLAVFFIKLAPPLICAVILYHVASARLRYWFRVMFVLPMIVPGIVYWLVWKLLYQPAPSGIFDRLLIPLENFLHYHGLEVQLAYNWLADPRTALGAIIFLGFPWVSTLGVLIYLAGLENIDPGLFEAAGIDGAGALKKFWYIELPLLARQIKLNLVLGLIGVIQGYGTILLLTKGGPAYATTVPGYQMYSEAFDAGRMGYASAIGLAMFVVILLATLAAGKAVKPQD